MHLIVIGEPNILPAKGSRNNALNEILIRYKEFNDKVTYVSYAEEGNIEFIHNGVNFFAIGCYSKEKRIILSSKQMILKRLSSLISTLDDEYHIQFRVPSLFSLQIYYFLREKINIKKISFYVAGNWKESLKFNYPSRPYLSFLLPKIEALVLKGNKCVFAGEELLRLHNRNVQDGFAFYSTTHTSTDIQLNFSKQNKKGICFIGRIEKLKNYNFIYKLSKGKLGKQYHFYMLGDGPDFCAFKDLIDKEKLSNITLCGHISDREIFDDIINECKYFILPSYTEGTSKTLPEMMCRNIIPIAFRDVGSNNFIINNKNGILVEVDSYAEVEKSIMQIDSDPELYKSYLIQGNEYAHNNTIDIQLDKMFKFLYEK